MIIRSWPTWCAAEPFGPMRPPSTDSATASRTSAAAQKADYWGPDTIYAYFKYEADVSAEAGDIIKVWGYSPHVPGWLVLDDVSIVKQ